MSAEQNPRSRENMSLLHEILVTVKNVCVAYFVSFYRFFIPQSPKSVFGDIVLITGSGSGMGRQLAVEFAKRGAVIVLWDIDKEGNNETLTIIEDIGGTAHSFIVDVSDRQAVYRTGEQVRQEVGDVTILINNAGVVTGKSLLESPDHMIERTFDVNLLAHFWTVKCFLPAMLRRNHGHVVNIASSVGLVGVNKLTDYSASKFGVVGFTEVLNYEIVFAGYDQVHTTVVCPSYTKTGMFEGCEMRFPAVIPPLETRATVEKIIQGILTNQHQICIPRLVYVVSVLKTMLPTDAMVEIVKFFGADKFMDTYTGRK
ncbi:short-chain dehydrogenase/reductase family 16C member 6-like [Haliotis rubra]|uniref:short-chain dehydrogenase/reductase family 16C member 6-like n=1 Tax=Haliotis rubra TaxID=36100 RepID=UPI001EE51E52|nr:short-chain dehydrogenase/reductase family 16C member 6-like [Haliotis rubra]